MTRSLECLETMACQKAAYNLKERLAYGCASNVDEKNTGKPRTGIDPRQICLVKSIVIEERLITVVS